MVESLWWNLFGLRHYNHWHHNLLFAIRYDYLSKGVQPWSVWSLTHFQLFRYLLMLISASCHPFDRVGNGDSFAFAFSLMMPYFCIVSPAVWHWSSLCTFYSWFQPCLTWSPALALFHCVAMASEPGFIPHLWELTAYCYFYPGHVPCYGSDHLEFNHTQICTEEYE